MFYLILITTCLKTPTSGIENVLQVIKVKATRIRFIINLYLLCFLRGNLFIYKKSTGGVAMSPGVDIMAGEMAE